MSAKKTAFYGMFLALALVAGYIEQLIPVNLGVPGVKLGLANIVTMLLLYIAGVPAALFPHLESYYPGSSLEADSQWYTVRQERR